MNEGAKEFICYSLPGSTEIISAEVTQIQWIDSLPVSLDCDFILAPFNKQHHKTGLIWYSPTDFKSLRTSRLSISAAQSSPGFSEYEENFKQVVQQIESGQLSKLVLSRIKSIKLEHDRIFDMYQNLVLNYPDAFVYILNLEEVGCWLGASPELLLEYDNKAWKTVALAGTKKNVDITQRIEWTNKEVEEQQIILDFLSRNFYEQKIDFEIGDKHIVKAGEVSHIKSDILFQSKAALGEILNVIHPGPAISGMPQKEAIRLIETIEAHDRSLYAGYLGPVTIDKNFTKLFVNLRCMNLIETGAQLYLGGGIVKDSELDAEWEETNLKAQTLLKILMPESNLSV